MTIQLNDRERENIRFQRQDDDDDENTFIANVEKST